MATKVFLTPSIVSTVAILIVLEQGWKYEKQRRFQTFVHCRNPHCTGAGLEDEDEPFKPDGSRAVAILIVLEQGWKTMLTRWSKLAAAVAILIVLEQGWKAGFFLGKSVHYGRNPHCTGAGLEGAPKGAEAAEEQSQSSLYWSRVGRLITSISSELLFRGRNPHCTGAGLEVS